MHTKTACKTEHRITTNALRSLQGSKLIPLNRYGVKGQNINFAEWFVYGGKFVSHIDKRLSQRNF
jgi:hypothetical protein